MNQAQAGANRASLPRCFGMHGCCMCCQASFLPACLEVDVRHTLQHKHHSPRLGLLSHCMGHNLCRPGLPFCENKPEALFVHCGLPRRQFGRCNTVKSPYQLCAQQGYCWHAGQMPGLIGNTKSPHDSDPAENQCLPWKSLPRGCHNQQSGVSESNKCLQAEWLRRGYMYLMVEEACLLEWAASQPPYRAW